MVSERILEEHLFIRELRVLGPKTPVNIRIHVINVECYASAGGMTGVKKVE